MPQGKTIIIALMALFIGLVSGFVLRPVIAPTMQITSVAPASGPQALAAADARSIHYFMANIDEARQVVAGCRDGSVRGAECAAAEEAIIKADAQERRRRFLGN